MENLFYIIQNNIMDNLEDINKEIDTYIDLSLESSRRIVGLTHLTKEVGTNIIEDLNENSERLHRINNLSSNINQNLNRTNTILNKMKCCFFPCLKKDNIINQKNSVIDTNIDENYSIRSIRNNDRFVKNITNDIREEQINSNLKEADSIINDIKKQAIIIGTEIDTQNKLIDEINNNIDNNNVNIKNIDKKVKNLL